VTARSIPFASDARPVRAAALWIALLVALASSLLSGGPPRTMAYGSAFNPATMVEALRPLRPTPRLLTAVVRPDPEPVAGAGDAAAAIAEFLPVVPIGHAPDTRPAPVVAQAIGASHSPLAGSPRGPPLT